MTFSVKPTQFFLTLFILCFFIKMDTNAQEIAAALTPEGHAYVYHDHLLPIGYGFNIYRIHEDEEVKLNDEPVFAATSGHDFRRILGDLYPIVKDGLEADSPQQAFLRLRGDAFNRTVLTLSYPQIAEAYGFLFVDENPVVDQQVTYRVEEVNQRGTPTGKDFERTIVIEESEVIQPQEVEVEKAGDEIQVTWVYPYIERAVDDIVIRFDVHMRPEGEEYFMRVNEESRLRLEGQTEFSYSIDAFHNVKRAEFIVEAIDITGQNNIASNPVEVELIDMTQPSAIYEVHSRVVDGVVELTWPVSTDPITAGYHIDRVNMDTEEEERITDELVDLRDPIFRDTTIESDYNIQYYVIAVSEYGVESERGNPALEHVVSVQYPEAPSNIHAEVLPEENIVEISWDPAEKDDLFNTYIVLRRTYDDREQRGGFAQVNDERLTEEFIIDDGVASEGFIEGRFYEYGVVAANRHGRRSDTLFTVVHMPNLTPPEPPAGIEASIHEGARINVVWSASPSTDVTSYNVYKFDQHRDTTIINQTKSKRFLADTDVSLGTEYTYFVTAVDSSGNESQPTRESIITMNNFSPPPSVRNIQAVETDEGVKLQWEPSAADDLNGYIIKRSPLINGQYVPLHDDVLTDTSWLDTDGEAGLWYRVFAVDVTGNQSRPSSARQATSGN
jgi:fibronectin type 3 domain-containing protein